MRLAPLLLFGLLAGCGSDFPTGGGNAGRLFPLAVGARWEYTNKNPGGADEPLVKEIVDCTEITFDDCETGEPRTHDAFVQETTGTGAADDAGRLYMESTSDGIVRVRQEFVRAGAESHYVTYSPYFMRLFSGPYSTGREETYDHERCEYEWETNAPRNFTTRHYRFTILEKRDVMVPFGRFEAVGIERVDLVDGDTKRYWYAEDVGKVLEEEILDGGSVGATEVLESYTAGDGSCP